MIEINLNDLYGDTAKLSELSVYVDKAMNISGDGKDIVITGPGPVWLYLKIAHALHGKAKSLTYRSPVTGDVAIFNHNPF